MAKPLAHISFRHRASFRVRRCLVLAMENQFLKYLPYAMTCKQKALKAFFNKGLKFGREIVFSYLTKSKCIKILTVIKH